MDPDERSRFQERGELEFEQSPGSASAGSARADSGGGTAAFGWKGAASVAALAGVAAVALTKGASSNAHNVEEARTVELGPDRSLHAITAGTGPEIVLVHGALATHRDWLDGAFAALAELGRVTAIDRPGHGLSRRPRFEGGPRATRRKFGTAS